MTGFKSSNKNHTMAYVLINLVGGGSEQFQDGSRQLEQEIDGLSNHLEINIY